VNVKVRCGNTSDLEKPLTYLIRRISYDVILSSKGTKNFCPPIFTVNLELAVPIIYALHLSFRVASWELYLSYSNKCNDGNGELDSN